MTQTHSLLVLCNFLIRRSPRTWGLVNISLGVCINGHPIYIFWNLWVLVVVLWCVCDEVWCGAVWCGWVGLGWGL